MNIGSSFLIANGGMHRAAGLFNYRKPSTPKDVLAEDAAIGRVRSGDVLLFVLAGAYGWSISHHDFLSHPHPEMIYMS
jgi:Diaminopimelate decarboxylase